MSIRKEVDEASERAKTDPELPVEELYSSLFIDPPSDLKIRGCDATIRASTKAWKLQYKTEPCHKKTCLRGLRPGKTQTGLFSHRKYLEAWDFAYRN